MKRFLPFLALIFGLLYVGSTLRSRAPKSDFDLTSFGQLPVLVNGRIKPLDTVARTSLLVIQSRQRVSNPAIKEEFVSSPIEWLATVLFNPVKADTFPTFRIESPEVIDLVGLTDSDVKIAYASSVKRFFAVLGFLPSTHSRFSFNQLQPKIAELDRQAQLADAVDAQVRTPFQKQVVRLRDNLMLYQRLKHSAQAPDSADFLSELTQFHRALPGGVESVRNRQQGKPHDDDAFKAMMAMASRYDAMDKMSYFFAVPPVADADDTAWRSVGVTLLETFQTGTVNANVMAYAALGHSWRNNQPGQFNEIVRLYRDQLAKRFTPQLKKTYLETRFNAAEPFYVSMNLYALAFFVAIFSWLKWPVELGKSAFYLTLIAWILATAGIATRMWLEGRPPVTNLYSSALFVGWGAVGLCLVLEKIYKNAIASVAASMIGFATLLVAHHLSLAGDTLEMMRAVLDSNFWLATHVIVVTAGYSATFLAGFLAIIYVLRGAFTKSLDKPAADSLARMVYGIVCFATLFSLVGTVLGGIWADQSWGRFWGWDPKENGALLIVLWNAIILHARWGGLVKQRGLMCLAIFGNVITSWSWFGTNMLGVGLHSYGFMDEAFNWLLIFVGIQLAIIGLAQIPLTKWRSSEAMKYDRLPETRFTKDGAIEV
ncbi:cytochrome c biogenesis protein [Oleiharenicola lentus]|uniref:cytochrome c biogenesis protein n=1 Tax=Oleiharenicola lentus TaxID=2508720 RepID=UPI003F66E174